MQKLKPLEEKGKIKLSFNPYTYVRTVVMRSLLLRKEGYQKMLKMGFSEIAKSLQETSYRKEISELSSHYSGADLIELALNRNLAESLKKLIRISSPEIKKIVEEYAKRRDIDDIKTILRGKFTKVSENEIDKSITAAGTLKMDFLLSLMKKESIESVLKSNSVVDFAALKSGLKHLNEKNSLAEIENALDRFYYTRLLWFSASLPNEGALFRSFVLKEIEIINILTLLRMKKAGISKEQIKNFMILSGEKKSDSKIAALIGTENALDILKALEKTEYKNIIAAAMDEFSRTGSLIALETGIYKHLLRQSILFMHQHPLSVDVILGYMFAKEIEVRNLKLIVKGKQLGLNEDFIESQLVYE